MLLGAYAMGANRGIVYVRAEYPLAVYRLTKAIEAARDYGLLGKNILGTKLSFDIEVVTGAGAFVCGEETALIASIEGKAGALDRALPSPPKKASRSAYVNQQRRDMVQHSRHRRAGRHMVRELRHTHEPRHESVQLCRQGAQHRPCGTSPRQYPRERDLRHLRRHGPQEEDQGRTVRRPFRWLCACKPLQDTHRL